MKPANITCDCRTLAGPSQMRGSALIIVLAFIVLSAIVLLSFLAATQSSAKKSASSEAIVLTEFLAETATAALIEDLRQEMLAGADGTTAPEVGESMLVSQPWAMVPARVLTAGVSPTNTNFFNLVKQSVRERAFYPSTNNPASYTAKGGDAPATGRIRASAANSATASKNNRMISTNRWNKPMLLSGGGFTSTNQLPDWVLISRRGPLSNGSTLGDYANKKADNEDFVIGRFAYNIYDVGGLLDINVAGFDPNAVNAQTNAAVKGSVAWADLRAIPGISNPQSIVQWRNKLSSTSADSYQNMIKTWGEPNGFLKSYRSAGAIENRFFSRQDLLKYAQSHGSNAMSTNALPFLTTFSADTDRPSFTPDSSRPKVQRSSAGGGNDAFGNDNALNPSLLTVKNADGTPAIKRRFPLDRLKYLVPGSTASEIEKYFGLTWNASERAWEYQGNQIQRLSAITGREPNFFELLQASIAAGSLGNQYQVDMEPAISPRVLGGRDGSVSLQIAQIAANIIDQYDADSYPTRILINGAMVYGIEDLPYLFHVRTLAYKQELVQQTELKSNNSTPITLPPAGAPFRSVVLNQPSVWNPHAPSGASGPTRFRVVATGTLRPYGANGWWTSGQWAERSWVANYPSINPKDTNPNTPFQPATDFITFQVTSSGDATFREPFPLGYPNYPAGSNAAPSGAGNTILETVLAGSQKDLPDTSAFGFRAGWVWAGPAINASQYFTKAKLESSMDYELQYEGADGNFVTYDVMPSMLPYDGNIFNIEVPSEGASYAPKPRSWVRLDPRSDRMGYRNMVYFPGASSAGTVWFNGETYRSDVSRGGVGLGDLGGGIAFSQLGWTSNANPATTTYWGLASANNRTAANGQTLYYTDPDGVQRMAMGGVANLTSGAGLPMAKATSNFDSRPVILNRPFRSVAELGYAFRGTPWKQLDFWTPESGDTALLDVFCLYEAEKEDELVVAGRVNLNTRQSEVLQALLRGAALSTENPATTVSTNEAKNIADQLVAWTRSTHSSQGPLRNRAELVGRFVSGTNYSGFSTNAAGALNTTDRPFSMRRQLPVRSFVDAGTTRTWTFLIDLVVQKGRYPANVSGLDNFVVEGEQRYWVHVAMDRYTGEVISQMVEAVND